MNDDKLREVAIGIAESFMHFSPSGGDLTDDEWRAAFDMFLREGRRLRIAAGIIANPTLILDTNIGVLNAVLQSDALSHRDRRALYEIWDTHCAQRLKIGKGEGLPPLMPTRIYLMRSGCGKFYKIGHSKQPEARERTLQAEQPSLKMVGNWEGYVDTERRLHDKFSALWVRGEWYRLSERTVEYFGEIVDEQNKEISAERALTTSIKSIL